MNKLYATARRSPSASTYHPARQTKLRTPPKTALAIKLAACLLTLSLGGLVSTSAAQSRPAADAPSEVVFFPGPFGALVSHDNADANAGAPGSQAGWHIPGGNYRAGKGWWALVCDLEAQAGAGKAGCSLHATQLSVKRGKHSVYDSDPINSQLLHWSPLPAGLDRVPYESDRPPLLIAVFKPVGKALKLNLQAGPVPTYVHRGMDDYPATRVPGTLEIRLPMPDGRHADIVPRVRMPKQEAPKATAQPEIDTFELRFGKLRQRLPGYTFSGLEEDYVSLDRKNYLLWAGDLDGDGKPDLIINHGEPGLNVSLYLSSLARDGELVGLAGQFQFMDPSSAGC